MSSKEDRLILLHLDRISAFLHPDGRIRREDPTQAQLQAIDRVKEDSERICKEAQRSCVWRQYKFQGDVSEEICKQAEVDKVSQVVMGSRGLGRLGGFVLGSISQGVLKECQCPVTFVKHKE